MREWWEEVGIVKIQKLEEESLPSCDLDLRRGGGYCAAGASISEIRTSEDGHQLTGASASEVVQVWLHECWKAAASDKSCHHQGKEDMWLGDPNRKGD